MNKKYLLLPDNSFRENYCYYSTERELIEQDKKWNSIIASIGSQFSGFEDKDYRLVYIPLCMFEAVGFGAFNKELSVDKKQLLNKCFSLASDLLIPKEVFEESQEKVITEILDKHLSWTFNNLFEFYKNELDPKQIVIKIDNHLKKKFHPNAECLRKQLVEWRNDIKLGEAGTALKQLSRDLAWDAFVKHERWFIADSRFFEIRDGNREYLKLWEKEFIRRLIAYYLGYGNNNNYLHGSVLLVKYARLLKSKKEKSNLLRPYQIDQELLDPYLTEYACSGFYDTEVGQRRSVIILTCDKKQKNRVIDYIDAKGAINKDLEKIGMGKHAFVPGFIIVIDSEIHKVKDSIIDVSKLMPK